ncbi:Fukutin-related protein-like 2 [Homarus americanus]|uniref:Fukutin-related protein-like 2 n=1 Tax=Homarus americanus TaxID=6706 RepID=A0A8J5KEE3_HOMAM|nr:Fukutin-related protein-like 2 [Homarus americanus]
MISEKAPAPLAIPYRGDDATHNEECSKDTKSRESSPRLCPPCLTPTHQHSPHEGSPESLQVAYRRRLAGTLANIHRQIARLAGISAVVDAKWALTLGALIEELDPRIEASTNASSWDYSARLPDMGPAPPLPGRTRHVCPEVYFGRRYDKPFHQHGMEPENCTYVPPFNSVLTAVLPAMSWPPHTTNFVITQIRRWYDIPILALVPENSLVDTNVNNVRFLSSRKKSSDATLLNAVVKKVTTPYVFMGTSLAHFSNQSSLERLVRVLDELEHVKVAGGAARDLQGHWIHGCLQQRMADYQATYTMGYYYSKYECMYCDDVLTPFITTVKLVNKVAFTSSLSGPAVYRDWLAKVREAGHLTMVCPDVMFFLTNHVNMTSEDWLPMARHWALQKVSYNGKSFTFTCKQINISCNNTLSVTKSFLLPPCCVDIAHRELDIMMDLAEENGLQYELQAGSVLGAVKFGSYLPWDTDHDIYIECDDFKTWYKKFSTVAKTMNCLLKIRYKKTFLKIVCLSFTLDMLCRNVLSKQFLPAEYLSTPTSIWYSGRWVKVSANPGLFSRNSMGLEVLKHQQHPAHLRGNNYTRPGTWLSCRSPQHHSCLDHFPADGNLHFSILT